MNPQAVGVRICVCVCDLRGTKHLSGNKKHPGNTFLTSSSRRACLFFFLACSCLCSSCSKSSRRCSLSFCSMSSSSSSSSCSRVWGAQDTEQVLLNVRSAQMMNHHQPLVTSRCTLQSKGSNMRGFLILFTLANHKLALVPAGVTGFTL